MSKEKVSIDNMYHHFQIAPKMVETYGVPVSTWPGGALAKSGANLQAAGAVARPTRFRGR
jgi:hypothetical protein